MMKMVMMMMMMMMMMIKMVMRLSQGWRKYFNENLIFGFSIIYSRGLSVGDGDDDTTDQQKEYDDEEDAIGSEENPGLFQGTAVAEDRDDQDESTDSDQYVCCLLNHSRLYKVLRRNGHE